MLQDDRVAYDEELAGRVRSAVPGAVEKRMFSGLAFMLGGNMAVGVFKDGLLVRLSPDEVPDALAEEGTSPFVMSGRQTKGWVMVDPAVVRDDPSLRNWVTRGVAYARSLPEK